MTTARSFALILAMSVGISAVGVAGFSQSQNAPAAAGAAQEIAVGDILPRDQVHIIKELGLYGLGRNVGGSEYAVAMGRLIRIDPKTMKVLSILRPQDAILD
ncbi:MAG: hypothetical protein ACK5IP_08795 [Paracoccus sp. (in: a-proteobacteria)]